MKIFKILFCTAGLLMTLFLFIFLNYYREMLCNGADSSGNIVYVNKMLRNVKFDANQSDNKIKIVALGDSSFGWMLPEREKNNLGNSIERQLSDSKQELYFDLLTVYGPGFHSYDYYFLMNKLVDWKPKYLIIPINLRSFGGSWTQNELWMYPQFIAFSRLSEFGTIFNLFSATSPRKFDLIEFFVRKVDYIFFNAALLKWKSQQNINQTNQDLYVASVGKDDHNIRAFKALVQLCKSNNIKIFFYFPPSHNLKFPLSQQENLKRKTIAYLSDTNTKFIDTLSVLENTDYLDEWEHYTEKGTNKIAVILAEAIKQNLADNEH